MIEQIPSVVHVVTTAKSRKIETPVGKYELHQMVPGFFTGFEPPNGGPAQIAMPEKALVDFFYFRPTKTRAFRSLPELSLPKGFSKRSVSAFTRLIASASRRAMVEMLFERLERG